MQEPALSPTGRMRICLYLEGERIVRRSGFFRAYTNHMHALQLAGIEVTSEPRERYDLLHTHNMGLSTVYWIGRARRRGIPVVAHAHSLGRYDLSGSFTGSSRIAPAYEKYLDHVYRLADAVFVPSEFAQRVLKARGHVRIEVVSNGVDSEYFGFTEEGRREWRRRLGLEGFVVYSAGHVFLRKGIADFIELARRFPSVPFVWFGHRWSRALSFHRRLERALREAPPNARFVGFVEDVRGAFSACDLFLFTTHGETQSLVVLESASLGRALVLRDLPAFESLPAEACVRCTDLDGFEAVLSSLQEDPERFGALSQGARAWAAKHSLQAVGDQLVERYRGILS